MLLRSFRWAALLALLGVAFACEAQSQSGETGGGDDDDGGGGEGGAGGAGGGGGAAVTRGAFAVPVIDSGVDCNVAAHNGTLGSVSATSKPFTVANGENGALITCTVTGTGPYGIVANATQAGNQLTFEVTMDATASLMTPALGTVTFASPTTVQTMSSAGATCQFWFEPNGSQGVMGKDVWLSFKCDEVTGGPAGTCGLGNSYAAFENCGP